jgi:transcriptional regulator with XRE-family HTH domain
MTHVALFIVNNKTRDAICSEVAKLLREERLRQKLSMNRVAERAGLSYQMISYVEREMRNPTLETMLRIVSALSLNLSEIIAQAEKSVGIKLQLSDRS